MTQGLRMRPSHVDVKSPPHRAVGLRSLPAVRARFAAGSVLVVLALWQLAGQTGLVDVQFTSTPAAIASAGGDLLGSGELWANAQTTLVEFFAGFLLAVVAGVPVGMLMGWKLRIRQTLEPALVALYVTPSLALLPLVVLALGIGEASKIAMVFLEAVITIAVNAMAGIRETDPKLVQAARAFCASEGAMFGKILFPSALPTIMAGLRLGAGRGVIAVIVAELYGGTDGVGQLISTYGQNFDVAPLLFLTLVVGIFGYAVTALLRVLGTAATSWER
ncbi:ABC transporter permease [Amycolatopsis saalfeldensis]|uniref:NitT/TauT family transport system permease protein n=1 Tax=Amycolatopsis saalfeldensis TaxID=394193 RepID=A0A1H8XDM6_9PSEU|nr:ABC transporter permease [Amycolatopsis saalfeldensis]SEP38030.1 NitT/TauT family transport system permease protein [Amycolatopsis saalfeldensis]